jgi:predicted TPR repeat methyltransferase
MEPTDQNLRAWEEAHRRRAEATAGRHGLPPQVRRSLSKLEGKRVLNLECGTGEAAAELADLGAVVTGVDVSEAALEIARERRPAILWVHAEVDALPPELRRGRFDLVYTGDGVLPWIDDLDRWARGIVEALRPEGELLLFDAHPVAACVDGLMHWRESYFDDSVRPGERHRRLGQLVTALARAGLRVLALEEYPARPGNVARHDARLPGEFLLYARKE